MNVKHTGAIQANYLSTGVLMGRGNVCVYLLLATSVPPVRWICDFKYKTPTRVSMQIQKQQTVGSRRKEKPLVL